MHVGVFGREMSAYKVPEAARVLELMTTHGLKPRLQPSLAGWLARHGHGMELPVLAEDLRADLELAISLGGDGTLLDALAEVGRSGVPVLGINLGRLGFLSSVHLENAQSALQAIAERRFTLEERSLVELVTGGEAFGPRNFALNELSVHKRDTSSMISVHASVGGRYLNTYWADGLIVATPTGSTAYSLSCGGPLLDPASQAMVITPISPHNLNVRPFVVPDDLPIDLHVETRGDNCLVNLDSRSITLGPSVELRVRKAGFKAKLVRMADFDFLDTLRTKLAWGLDARSGPPPSGRND